MLFVGAKSEFYLILYYTWWTLLLAGSVGWLVARLPRLGPAIAVLAVLLAPLVFGLQESYEDIQTAVDTYRERGYYAEYTVLEATDCDRNHTIDDITADTFIQPQLVHTQQIQQIRNRDEQDAEYDIGHIPATIF